VLDRLERAGLIDDLRSRAQTLAHDLEHSNGSVVEHAKYFRDTIVPGMATLREAGDAIEMLVPHGEWPLPTYREMLFIK